MTQRSLLLSVFVLFFSIIGNTPRSLAATSDPASFVGDLGTRAIAAMRNGDTAPKFCIGRKKLPNLVDSATAGVFCAAQQARSAVVCPLI